METPARATDAGQGMMRALVVISVLAASSCAPADPAASAAQQWAVCESESSPEARIDACAATIADPAAAPERRVAAYINRGVVRAGFQQHARALGDFGRALRIDAHNESALLQRGRLHHERGAYDQAMVDFDAVLARSPQLTVALVDRQIALDAIEEAYDEDLARLDDDLQLAPGDPRLLNARCWLRVSHDGDLTLALEDCDSSLRVAPDDANVLDSRGLVRLKRGEFAAALADYEAALALSPGNGHYLYGRGLAQLGLGMRTEGEASLAAGEAADPNVARNYLRYGAAPR